MIPCFLAPYLNSEGARVVLPHQVATSLEALTPYCDFVARIENESVPQLLAFERVDHSGNWVLIKNEFEAKALVRPLRLSIGHVLEAFP